ncbi:MAG: PIN domain-containing protein [Candidatus Viridilinea halotolerans]|uniref:Ribonuclease VapC n=1 Tax=Candidatus Viridilinea halotolerans TaxID=2491704 RepID=A0A426TY09_9CHLR|nr:MAG: PIN domain-containing protein [Candidatus Viridilinea halotolerans]
MSDQRYVLDTSAILTLIEDEPGAARVEHVLRSEQVTIPWISSFEVTYITQQERGVAEAERRYALIKALPVTHLWELDEALLLTAARLKATHRLSLADTMIAACALREQAILLHKDPEYEALAGEVALEHLPYKSGG